MATILVYDVDQQHQKQLAVKLEQQGHKVWLANQLSDVNALLNNVDIHLMILDLDQENLDEVVQFGDRWRGVKIVFQSSKVNLKQDFRTWLADDFICKGENGGSIFHTLNRLLDKRLNSTRN